MVFKKKLFSSFLQFFSENLLSFMIYLYICSPKSSTMATFKSGQKVSKYIVQSLIKENLYTETLDKLDNKKSNYLVDNNQVYYYSRLLNGKKPETTIWMRFVLGKISRELEKNRWSYLSERMIGTVKNRIDGILSRVQTSFSIIRRIQVSEFEIDYSNYKINLSIETWISDLIDNHMKLDITINYKNYNNS